MEGASLAAGKDDGQPLPYTLRSRVMLESYIASITSSSTSYIVSWAGQATHVLCHAKTKLNRWLSHQLRSDESVVTDRWGMSRFVGSVFGAVLYMPGYLSCSEVRDADVEVTVLPVQ